VTQRHDGQVSILDLVERSRHLGPPLPVDPTAVPVEIVECVEEASAEGYITALHAVDADTRVEILLDHGLTGVATLATFDAEWLALEVGQIVPVRIDRWLSFD